MAPKKDDWTWQEEAWLRKHYPDMTRFELAGPLGKTPDAVQKKATRMGLRKSAAFRSANPYRTERQRTEIAKTRFKPGHKTWNTGMKGLDMGGRSVDTRFKPGRLPHNHVPVGTIVPATDSRGQYTYLKIKIAEPKTWKFLHTLNWEAVNGPVPPGHVLIFRDGNRENCAVENLECITRGENSSRNRWKHWNDIPQPLKQAISLKNQLINTLREIKNDQALHSQ